jgi:tetratricopeptide (TPR) repeat protein
MNDAQHSDKHLMQAAVALCREGRFADAETVLGQTLKRSPDHFDALYLLGCIAVQTSRPERASELLQRAIRRNGAVAAAHCHLGHAQRALSRLDDALTSYSNAIRLGDASNAAYVGRAMTLVSLGRHAQALADFDQALAAGVDEPAVHTLRASALLGLQRPADALASSDKALSKQPQSPDAHLNRAVALHALGRINDSVQSAERAIELKPSFNDAYLCLGAALIELRRVEEALRSADRAIHLQPDHAGAHNLRALCLLDLERPAEAKTSAESALRVNPMLADAHNSLGLALSSLKSLDEANASFDRAIHLQPDRSEPHFNKGANLLLTGRFPLGWELYERRLSAGRGPRSVADGRPWDGSADIVGKTLFVHAEQGLGDTLQFCRYAPLLAARGAQVILSVPDSLRALLSGLGPGVEVIGSMDRPRRYDFHCPLLSLPRACRTDLESIPSSVPYLWADPARVAAWRRRLGTEGRLIGIRWQGGTSRVDVGRSFPLRHFESLAAIPGVRLISLQRDAGCEQLAQFPSHLPVEDIGNELDPDGAKTFLDTAAVMQCLELVITSDTSVAHLAGALGRPTWLALKHVPDWRWMLDREDSPWYPTMRLFRQPKPGDWAAVFAVIHSELERSP